MTTSVQSVSSTPATSGTTSTASSIMGKDDFLKLLITQMQNQDPLNPLSGSDYAAQLAQFSSVEQLSNINTNLTQSLQQNQLLTQSIGNSLAATLIGKDIRATGNSFAYTGSQNQQIGYTLSTNAATASVGIYDSTGTLVKTFKNSGSDAGDHSLTWDGTDDNGTHLAAGTYTFKVTAADDKGSAVTSSSFTIGTIDGVRYKSDGAYFLINGAEVSLSDVLEILQG